MPCLVLSIPASLSVNILYAKYSKLKHHTVRKCYNCRTLPQEIFSTVRRSLHVVWACCKVWPDYACLWSTKPCHTTRVRSPDRRWHITSVWLHFTCGFSRWCQRNVHDVLSLFDCFFTNARVCKCTLFALVSSSTFMPEYKRGVQPKCGVQTKKCGVQNEKMWSHCAKVAFFSLSEALCDFKICQNAFAAIPDHAGGANDAPRLPSQLATSHPPHSTPSAPRSSRFRFAHVVKSKKNLWIILCFMPGRRRHSVISESVRPSVRLSVQSFVPLLTNTPPAQAPPRCNSPPINSQCTNHRIVVRCQLNR